MKKLQNKKTGEIGNLVLNINPNRESYSVLSTENGDTICGNLVIADYDTLAELNKEWEDYETREGFKQFIKLNKCFVVGFYDEESSTKELEKAKAWQRLKDKGFKFTGYYLGLGGNYSIKFETGMKCDTEDLDLLFGGEDA